VWALGADQPGIVAAVTGALFERGGNLRDTSMTILSGHFAMMLLVDAPDGLDESEIEQALAPAASTFDLVVAARRVDPDAVGDAAVPSHVVAVYGADRPGIVHRVTSALAEVGVNITDVNTRVIGDASEPVYAMLLEVVLPAGADAAAVDDRLRALARDLGVETSMHAADPDIL